MKLHDDQPCKHMESLLNKTAEGKTKGLARWYTLAHAAKCHGCGKFLAALRAMLPGLKSMKQDPVEEMPEDRWQELEKEWAAAEKT